MHQSYENFSQDHESAIRFLPLAARRDLKKKTKLNMA